MLLRAGAVSHVQHTGADVIEVPAGVTKTIGSSFELDDGRTWRILGTLELPSFNSTVSNGATLENHGTIHLTHQFRPYLGRLRPDQRR